MDIFIALLVVVWAILQIILFFKIWGMTNNVAKILDILKNPKGDVMNEVSQGSRLEVGDVVYIIPKNKLSTIISINDGKIECASMNGNFYDGVFSINELKRQ